MQGPPSGGMAPLMQRGPPSGPPPMRGPPSGVSSNIANLCVMFCYILLLTFLFPAFLKGPPPPPQMNQQYRGPPPPPR